MTNEFPHTPVLLPQTIEALQPKPGGRYIDATLGGGGHAEKILDMSGSTSVLLGIDADPAALKAAKQRLSPFGDRVTLVQSYFDEMGTVARANDFVGVDGILFDLGVSSPQLDTDQRGFSFQHAAPLDMRMDPSANATARDLVNTLSEFELARIFYEYGEERYSRRIARRILQTRRDTPLETTTDLVDVIMHAAPQPHREGIHPATRVFQALRIAVNDELGRLSRALPQALDLLHEGGRLAVISFHSLEDRIVKQFMRAEARDCLCPPQIPVCVCGHTASLRILTRRPMTASAVEIANNPRSRSAKLRVAERIYASS